MKPIYLDVEYRCNLDVDVDVDLDGLDVHQNVDVEWSTINPGYSQ